MPGGSRAHRVLQVQRRTGGRNRGDAIGYRVRGPADGRPERGGHGQHHSKPRRGIFRQIQVPVRSMDFARRDHQQTGKCGRRM